MATKQPRGGSRPGAGRPRSILSPELREKIGPPPTDKPLELQRWYSRNLAVMLWLYQTTGSHVQMLREVKSAAGIAGRMMPIDVVVAAYNKLKSDEQELQGDEDPEEEVRKPDASRARAVRRDAP